MSRTSHLNKVSTSARKLTSKPRGWYLRACTLLMGVLSCLSFTTQAIEPSKVSLDKRLHERPSVDEVARQISEQLQWRILSAEPTVEDEKTLYRFKLLDKKRGRVQVIIIDPDEMPDLTALQ